MSTNAVKDKNEPEVQNQQIAEQLLTFDAPDLSDKAEYILAAAIQQFTTHGYSATNVRDIVTLADVTNPMLYYYFDDKEDVFHAAVDLIFRDHNENIQEVIDSDVPFETKIFNLFKYTMDYSRQRPLATKFIYSVMISPANAWPDFEIEDLHHSAEAGVAKLFDKAVEEGAIEPREGIDGDFFSKRVFGTISSHQMQALNYWEHTPSKEAGRKILDNMLNEDSANHLADFVLSGAVASYDTSD